jgi:uncharacterized protein
VSSGSGPPTPSRRPTCPGWRGGGAAAWPAADDVVAALAAELAEVAVWLGLDDVVVDQDAAGDLAGDLARRTPG